MRNNTMASTKMSFQQLTIAAILLLAVEQIHSFVVIRPSHSLYTPSNSNSQNTRYSRLYSSTSTSLPPGLSKTIKKEGSGNPLRVGDVATVKYSCYLPDDLTSPPFSKALGQKFVIGDGLMIDGWEIALQSMTNGEHSLITITDPQQYGYGTAGIPPIIPPNAPLALDIEILNVEAGADLGTIASADPLKPRTPSSIAAAYATRRELAAMEEANKLEGWEGLVEKVKGFYFFGFFEGETGERPPWYLRPSLTFPLAFLVVGAAFYVQFSMGGIKERGGQRLDELDEVILSSLVVGLMGFLGQ